MVILNIEKLDQEIKLKRASFIEKLEAEQGREFTPTERLICMVGFNEGWICASEQFKPVAELVLKAISKTTKGDANA